MNTVLQSKNLATIILGKQELDNQNDYRVLQFCHIMKINGETLVYNNLIKKMVILSPEEEKAIQKLPCVPDKSLLPMVNEWFLVPVNFDEFKLCDQVLETAKLYEDNSILNNFIILTTTDCNARCFYCYEHGVTRTNMTDQTAVDTADFIIKKSKGKHVTIKWFGGEPLYNLRCIDIICNRLHENNIDFSTHMTSNAYLFDSEVISRAKNEWNIKHVQITLDGTENVYNNIKAYTYKSDISPFKIVTDNIEALLNAEIRVSIRLNVSEKNRTDIYNLIDFICERYPDKKKLRVYASNMYDLDHTRSNEETKYLIDEYFKLDAYICKKGLHEYSLNQWSSLTRGCMAQNKKSVVISPNGLLGKCEHYSEGDLMFGSIYSDKNNDNAISYWYEHKFINSCKDCIAYPSCDGINNCPALSGKCEIFEKLIKLYNIEQSMIKEYYDYKKID